MDYGTIIKRAWQITWRYKALWVLGLFAGITGPQSGGGGNSGGGNSRGTGTSSGNPFPDMPKPAVIMDRMAEYLPVLIVGAVVLVVLGLLFWALGIVARGGLISGVSAHEEGRSKRLGELWSDGFASIWPMAGLHLLTGLPLLVAGLIMFALIGVPLLRAAFTNGQFGLETFAPVCGSLAIGVPLLFIGGIILGFMQIVGERFVMLERKGPVEAAKNGWRMLRTRFKDSALMYLISFGLTLAAGFALAVPVVIVAVAIAVPAAVAGTGGEWGALWGVVALGVLLLALVGGLFNAIWGTYTSALWTLFFRTATAPVSPAGYTAAPLSTDGGVA